MTVRLRFAFLCLSVSLLSTAAPQMAWSNGGVVSAPAPAPGGSSAASAGSAGVAPKPIVIVKPIVVEQNLQGDPSPTASSAAPSSASQAAPSNVPSPNSSSAIVRPAPETGVARPRARELGQRAIVKTEGAMVFDQATFDGQVIRYLPIGKKMIVSKKTYGNKYGLFYKARIDAGKFGYVATIDVDVEKGSADSDSDKAAAALSSSGAGAGSGAAAKKLQEERKAREEAEDERESKLSIYESRYFGVSVGQINYADTVAGSEMRENMIFFGLKFDGPRLLLAPPTEINLLLHYGAPSFYSPYSTSSPTGFVILTDWLLLFPVVNANSYMFSLGAGPMLSYSDWNVTSAGQNDGLVEASVGFSMSAAFVVRIHKEAIRFEYKYMIESHTQRGFNLAAQMRF